MELYWTNVLIRCNQYLLDTNISQMQCNCNKAPNSFSSHIDSVVRSQIQIMCHVDRMRVVEVIVVRSANICKTACNAYHAIKFGGEIITYKM